MPDDTFEFGTLLVVGVAALLLMVLMRLADVGS
jgi:hypothetical protein